MTPVITVFIALGIFAIVFLLGSAILTRAVMTLNADDKAKIVELQGQLLKQLAVTAVFFVLLMAGWMLLVLRPQFTSGLEAWFPFGVFGLVFVFLSTLGVLGHRHFGRMREANLPQQKAIQLRAAFWTQLGGTFFMLAALVWFVLRLRGII